MFIDELEKISPAHYCYDLRDQLKMHIYGRSSQAFAAGDSARDAVKTITDLDRRRRVLRKKFIESLGGLPSSDTPLKELRC